MNIHYLIPPSLFHTHVYKTSSPTCTLHAKDNGPQIKPSIVIEFPSLCWEINRSSPPAPSAAIIYQSAHLLNAARVCSP